MSNIIRTAQLLDNEKKIIQTKKIEKKLVATAEPTIDPAIKKQQLLQEVETLEVRLQELQLQLKEEQETAKKTIEQWWQDQQLEAKEHSERLAEEASKTGFDAGFQEGLLKAEQETEEMLQQMHDLVATAYEERNKIIQSSEAFLLSLSVKIAKKVIKEELSQDDDKLVNMVRLALKHIEESEDVTIQVAPEDYPIILPFLDELQTYVRADSELKLIPASNLSPGGCMIHTASGSYDVTVEGQLDEIKKQLLAYCEEKITDEHKD